MNIKQGFEALAEAEAKWEKTFARRAEIEERLRKAQDTGASFAAHDLERLSAIITGEERRNHKKWQEYQKCLMSVTNPERYSPESLAYLCSEGIVAVGHRVWLADEETGETDAVDVTHTDSPVNQAVINQRVGVIVYVRAPGGQFAYRIVQIAAIE